MRGQVLAIMLVIVGGVGVCIMSLSTYDSLLTTRDSYYRDYSFADVFGVLTEQYKRGQKPHKASWLVGDGLFAAGIQGKAIRSMKAPGTAYDDPLLGKDPQPYHMDDFVNTTSDRGGVHINSGIPNHAFFLLSVLLGGHAWEKAGKKVEKVAKDK